ncbi:peptidase domain-containing ABC transporter [Pantoea stewartii]|uniref:peptidase domain-containing ABC transporter n=1 Tax=Pantoea stewartii TaxID=66269 RepID=UPI00249EFA57|nr:peptidase domain-containing ABC transporter [Pantoea stewartii]
MRVLYQTERTECGLVTVAMIASHYGLEFDLIQLRNIYPTSMKGTNLKNLMDVFSKMNLESRPVRCDVEEIKELRLPAIIHWKMDHFVVLKKVKGNKYYINDPDLGSVVVSNHEFNKSFTGIALEVWPGPKFKKADKRSKINIQSIIPFSFELKKLIFYIFILALAIEISTLVIPILQEIILDDSVVTGDLDLLTILVIAIALFSFGSVVTTAVKSIIERKITSSLSIIVPSHIFKHIFSLHIGWFEKRSAADIANRFDSANTIHKTLTTSTISAVIDGLVGMLASVIMFYYSPVLASIVCVTFLIYSILRFAWYSNYRQKSAGSLKQNSKIQSFIWESLRGAATIKQFNANHQRHQKYLFMLGNYVRIQSDLQNINTAYTFIHDLIFAVEKIITIYLGAKLIINGGFTIGMFTAFMGFRENFINRGSSLINTLMEFRSLSVHLDRISDIILTPKEHDSSLPFLGDTVGIMKKISINNISYAYGENEKYIIKDCSFDVFKGETVALIGPSGIGKSTLLKIISGQLKPSSGNILIDDRALESIDYNMIRSIISFVRQDDMLFAGTITENIAFLEKKPDFEKVKRLAVSVNLHDEIQGMPMGYNTLIGPLGTGLSGGQAQRIMIARALYRSPQILLLDEATSHLDIKNEMIISNLLKNSGITQIIIAHRAETIAKADRAINISDLI